MWKETVVAKSKVGVISRYFPGETEEREKSVRIAGLRT
jgi:hypothetical protein